MAWAGYSADEILDRLIIEDIRSAADLFLPIYEESGGNDGFVSVEVGPAMAHNTEASLAEANRLWDLSNHPNVMVKIPATPEGVPAIRQAIADGLNINITLIFSIARYREVMDAYLSGLEERLRSGKPINQIASVASFFVSRIDNKIDPQLEKIIQAEGPDAAKAAGLLGKIAVANAKLAYAEYRKVFEGERFNKLAEHGAKVQRPLWASTSTKNPAYPDTKYVDELIGPNTVNTVPPNTLDAFRDHGTARLTVEEGLDEARREFQELDQLGISIDQVTQELEDEGVKAFGEAFQALTNTVDQRRQEAVRMLGPLQQAVVDRLTDLQSESLSTRIRAIDPTVWTKDPAGKHEIRNRMGAAGRAKALSRYTWDKITSQIEGIYLDLAQAKQEPRHDGVPVRSPQAAS
jgi:transaldolase